LLGIRTVAMDTNPQCLRFEGRLKLNSILMSTSFDALFLDVFIGYQVARLSHNRVGLSTTYFSIKRKKIGDEYYITNTLVLGLLEY